MSTRPTDLDTLRRSSLHTQMTQARASLAGGRDALRARPSPAAAVVQLCDALKTLALQQYGRQLDGLFERADERLFDLARRAGSSHQQAVCFATMRALHNGRATLTQSALHHFAASMEPEALPSTSRPAPQNYAAHEDELSLIGTDSLEKSIALSKLVTRAEGMYQQTLWELRRRLHALIQERYAPLASEALMPAALCQAFEFGAEALELAPDIGQLLYQLCDQFIVAELSGFYSAILRFFDQHGIAAARIVAAPTDLRAAGIAPANAPDAAAAPADILASAAASAAAEARPAFGGPTQSRADGRAAATQPSVAPAAAASGAIGGYVIGSLSPQTLQMLAQFSAVHSPFTRSAGDQLLAAELAAAAVGKPVAGWTPALAQTYVQRAGAVGEMFGQILTDPLLPGALKPQFDQLCFSVIKTALQDVRFFADPEHPVRRLVNELATLAGTAHVRNAQGLGQIQNLVGEIKKQFEIAADQIRAPETPPPPVDAAQLETFLEEQLGETRQRRQTIIDNVRRLVAEEIQLRSAGRNLPPAVRRLLNSGWAPAMGLRLLKQGADNDAWHDGLQLLDRLINAANPQMPAARCAATMKTLCADVERCFRDVGMTETRLRELLDDYATAIADIAEAAPGAGFPPPPAETPPAGTPSAGAPDAAPPAHTPESLLEQIIEPGKWFHLYDRSTGGYRWLKAVAYYPAKASVAFAHFNGRNTATLSADSVLQDLRSGLIQPLELSPAAQRAYAELNPDPRPLPADSPGLP